MKGINEKRKYLVMIVPYLTALGGAYAIKKLRDKE